jgi:HEAT repeat protein
MGRPALDLLSRTLTDPDAEVRQATVWALGEIGLPALAELTLALRNADADVRELAVYALSELGVPGLETLIGHALDDPDITVQTAITAVFAEMGALTLTALTRALEHAEATVRQHTVYALGELEPPALEALQHALASS